MIVLDTNVVSELMRPQPNERVVAWLERQSQASLFTTSVTRGEVLFGVRVLPEGQRRQRLWAVAKAIFDEDFVGRVIAFDDEAADAFATIGAERRAVGRPISQFDAMVAGIARSRGAAVATRNVDDFADCGISVFNPWSD